MRSVALASLFLSSSAIAGSIQAPGVIAGPDSGPTTPNPAAAYYNPGALGAAKGLQTMFDVQVAAVRVDVDAWRNDGIDPNTGKPYDTATARVVAPVMFLGASYEILEDQLTAGLALTMPFLGGGDYTSGEEEGAPPYTSHQRYFGVNTKVITGQVIPAVSYTPVQDWGLHVGVGMTYTIDIFKITKNSFFKMGSPDAPYSSDPLLKGETSGSHLGWTAGLFWDKYEKVQLGLSYTSGGRFNGEGEGSVSFPTALTNEDGPLEVDALLAIEMNLPEIWRMSVNSQINEKFNIGATLDHYRWNACCGDEDGDIKVTLTDTDGDPIAQEGEDLGNGKVGKYPIQTSVNETIYSPRRLWDASNFTLFAGYQANYNIWLGGRVAYNQNAVPDYAVSPTNLDFENAGFQIGTRYTFGEEGDASRWTVGLSYAKFFLFERKITNSAWNQWPNVGGPDLRFSPKETPKNVSANGHYQAAVDIVGLRVEFAH